jgi:hypothetical protein
VDQGELAVSKRRPHSRHDDSGAALLLAVGFVVLISAIGGGLAALATSSLNNRNALELVRNREYAADGAIEQAIADARTSTCSSVGGPTFDTLNSIAIRVDWVNACGVVQSSDGTVVAQRNIVFSACEGGLTSPVCLPANVIIRAEVNFEQASAGVTTKTYVQSWSVNR